MATVRQVVKKSAAGAFARSNSGDVSARIRAINSRKYMRWAENDYYNSSDNQILSDSGKKRAALAMIRAREMLGGRKYKVTKARKRKSSGSSGG